MKKLLLTSLLATSIFAASFGGCATGNNEENFSGQSFSRINSYGFGAVSTVKLMSSLSDGQSDTDSENVGELPPTEEGELPPTEEGELPPTEEGETPPTEDGETPPAEEGETLPTEEGETPPTEDPVVDEADKFNDYFNALNDFILNTSICSVTEANTDEAYADYAIKLTVNTKNLKGDSVKYILYYNETLVTNYIDLDDDNDNCKDDNDNCKDDNDNCEENLKKHGGNHFGKGYNYKKHDDKEVTAYTLSGVMMLDGVEYYLDGCRITEVEDDETEEKLFIRAYADMEDKNTYVEMKYETSTEDGESETEYVYSTYVDSVLVECTKVEFETEVEGNKTETEYKISFVSGENRGSYKIEKEEKSNKVEFKVSYNLDGEKGVFKIMEFTNELGEKVYKYSFSENCTKEYKGCCHNQEN